MQLVHTAFPEPIAYLPATHKKQGPALGPAEPALQRQSTASSLASGAFEFGAHCWHVVLLVAFTVVEYSPSKHETQLSFPGKTLYFPALHAMHGPPFAPVNPALQMQLSKTWLCAGACELLGHARHVLSPIPEKLSASHGRQLSLESEISVPEK